MNIPLEALVVNRLVDEPVKMADFHVNFLRLASLWMAPGGVVTLLRSPFGVSPEEIDVLGGSARPLEGVIEKAVELHVTDFFRRLQ